MNVWILGRLRYAKGYPKYEPISPLCDQAQALYGRSEKEMKSAYIKRIENWFKKDFFTADVSSLLLIE